MIKEYKIVRATNIDDLEAQVNAHIKDGWQPVGQVVVVHEPVRFVCMQTLVREGRY